MKRTTHQEVQIYDIAVWAHIEILNCFMPGGVLLCIKGMQ